MLLSFITNDLAMATAGEAAGIDRVFIDLERLGKADRQSGRCLFLSEHSLNDVHRMKKALVKSNIMVRVDPLNAGSGQQIDRVICDGATVVMLPWFHRLEQVNKFIDLVAERAKVALLVETPAAVAVLPALCKLPGIAEIHIGLNDLSLALNRPFLFDVIADGTIDRICAILRASGVPFGFGGIGSLSRNDLPINPEWILAEQVLQGATRGWLSRTFRDVPVSQLFQEVQCLRRATEFWKSAGPKQQEVIQSRLRRLILSVSSRMKQTVRVLA